MTLSQNHNYGWRGSATSAFLIPEEFDPSLWVYVLCHVQKEWFSLQFTSKMYKVLQYNNILLHFTLTQLKVHPKIKLIYSSHTNRTTNMWFTQVIQMCTTKKMLLFVSLQNWQNFGGKFVFFYRKCFVKHFSISLKWFCVTEIMNVIYLKTYCYNLVCLLVIFFFIL